MHSGDMWSMTCLRRNYCSLIVQKLFFSTTPDMITLNPVLLSSWKCHCHQKWTIFFFMLDLSDFHKACLLAHLAHLSKDLSDLCATTAFEFSSSKQSLQDTSFLQVLLKTEAWWNSNPAKTWFVCRRALSTVMVSYQYQVFVEEGLSQDPSWLQLQWGQDAVPCPGPAHGWSHGAAAVVRALSTGGSRGDPTEELWLLECLQGELKATGCGSLTTQLVASFQHKWF